MILKKCTSYMALRRTTMIFSELYSAYYNAVAEILKKAVKGPINKNDIRNIVGKYAFSESIINIEPALVEEKWQLLLPNGTTPIKKEPKMPLTNIEKRWLKAIFQDPRIKLFTDDTLDFPDVEPLFTNEDYYIFDKYNDGDSFEDKQYIANFRTALDGIRNKYPLIIKMKNRYDKDICFKFFPEYMEYSEKDDKFRLISNDKHYGGTINMGRVISCEKYDGRLKYKKYTKKASKNKTVVFELIDERNALERVLMHFAHFEKQVEKVEEEKYIVTINYDKDDETEIVIRILSFGQMVKVVEPNSFIDLIKDRLLKQKSCGL